MTEKVVFLINPGPNKAMFNSNILKLISSPFFKTLFKQINTPNGTRGKHFHHRLQFLQLFKVQFPH